MRSEGNEGRNKVMPSWLHSLFSSIWSWITYLVPLNLEDLICHVAIMPTHRVGLMRLGWSRLEENSIYYPLLFIFEYLCPDTHFQGGENDAYLGLDSGIWHSLMDPDPRWPFVTPLLYALEMPLLWGGARWGLWSQTTSFSVSLPYKTRSTLPFTRVISVGPLIHFPTFYIAP